MGFPASSIKRPLISAKEKEKTPDELLRQYRDEGEKDLTFLAGYSDKRRLMDEQERRGIPVTVELSHRLQFVTVNRPNGRPDGQKATQFRAAGYSFVKWDEASKYGIEIPAHAEKTPDGFIKVGDTQLMACPAERAAQNEAQGREAIDARTSDEGTGSDLRSTADSLGAVGQGSVTKDLNWSKSETKVTTKG